MSILPDSRPLVVAVGGATASGKTDFAIQLALQLQTEVFSCDSRQFYQEMSIGTAVPNAAELAAVPHHFIQHRSIHDTYTVGDYEREALAALEVHFRRFSTAVLVGGSGLFMRALLEGLDTFPEIPENIRIELRNELENNGLESLCAELKTCDPDYYAQVDLRNPARILRALEVCRATQQPYSSFRQQNPAPRPFRVVKIGLDWERNALYDRINRRVLQMMEQGLLAEAQQLYPYRHRTALNTVGYTELFDYFEQKTDLDTAIARIQQHSRNYAKRQTTWFRKESGLIWVNAAEMSAAQALETHINPLLHP